MDDLQARIAYINVIDPEPKVNNRLRGFDANDFEKDGALLHLRWQDVVAREVARKASDAHYQSLFWVIARLTG